MDTEQLLNIVINSLKEEIINAEFYVYDKELVEIKRMSIGVLKNEEEMDSWLMKLTLLVLDNKLKFPTEVFLVAGMYLNKDSIENQYLLKLDKFNSLLIERLLAEVQYNLSKDLLRKTIRRINVNNNVEQKKKILLRKIDQLVEISIESKEDFIIGFKCPNISKVEISAYFSGEINLYYLTNGNNEIINIVTGERLLTINVDKKELPYRILQSYLAEGKRRNVFLWEKYERLLLYDAFKYIAEEYEVNKSIVEIDVEEIKSLLEFKGLFSIEYINKLEMKINVSSIKIYLDKIKNNPSLDTLKKIIEDCNDIDWIFEILKAAPNLMNTEIPIDIYLEGIIKCCNINKSNIKIALFCEELVVNNPVIIEEVVEILVELYRAKVYTNNTLEVLEYLRCTVSDNRIIDETLVKIQADKGEFNKEFYEKFFKLYETYEDKSKLDELINKIVNYSHKEINEKLYKPVYDFYIRNNDLRALELLTLDIINNKKSLQQHGIKDKDIYCLLKYIMQTRKYNDKKYIFGLINEYIDSNEVLEMAVEIFEEIKIFDYLKLEDDLLPVYYNIIKRIKNNNETIKLIYLDLLLNKEKNYKYNEEEIDDLIIELNNNIHNRIEIIRIIIRYYIENNLYSTAILYIQNYLDNLSSDDKGNLFNDILIAYYDNLDFIEIVLKEIDLKEVSNVDHILNIAFNRLVDNGRYELLVEIIRYYKDNEKFNKCIPILLKYIENVDEIDELTYEVFILPILNALNVKKKEKKCIEIYNSLLKRNDLISDVREAFYQLNPCVENTNKIIDDFENGLSFSALAKNLTLEKYFNEEFMFSRYISKGDSDEKTAEIVYEKAVLVFEEDKEFVDEIITNELAAMDSRLKLIKGYALEYSHNEFDLSKSKVIAKHTVSSKAAGEVCLEAELKDIFNEEAKEIKAIIIKDSSFYNVIISYFEENNIPFNVIDRNVISMSDVNENGSDIMDLMSLIKSFNKLINLQMRLISNKLILTDFLQDAFILKEDVFIPKSYIGISKFTEEFVCKNTKLFENIRGINNKNRHIVINEVNIVKIMMFYFKKFLEEAETVEAEERLKCKFINGVLEGTFESLCELRERIEVFIEDESKTFEELSYRTQIERYDQISIENKIKVISKAIIDKDISPRVKEKVIYFDFVPEDIKEDHFRYLVDCFNNVSDFSKDGYGRIYEKVLGMIEERISSEKIIGEFNAVSGSVVKKITKADNTAISEKSIIENKAALESLFIDAKKKCGFKPHEISNDISKFGKYIEVEYITDKVMS